MKAETPVCIPAFAYFYPSSELEQKRQLARERLVMAKKNVDREAQIHQLRAVK